MKSVNNYLRSLSGLLLAAPTTYVIFISIMKYGFGWGYLFDNSQPFLERLGIRESLGWNINLLILLGPVVALAVIILSSLVLLILFVYLMGENCR